MENANLIVRYFLGMNSPLDLGRIWLTRTLPVAIGKVETARSLLREYEHHLTSPVPVSVPEWCRLELMNYKDFFDVWDSIKRTKECAAIGQENDERRQRGGVARETHSVWLRDYKVCACLSS